MVLPYTGAGPTFAVCTMFCDGFTLHRSWTYLCSLQMFCNGFTLILLLHEWRWAWLHALWVLRWLLNPIGAPNSREQRGHGCSCCPGAGGFWALSLRRRCFWIAFWIRSFSYSVTREWTLLRQAGRSDASTSQALWSMVLPYTGAGPTFAVCTMLCNGLTLHRSWTHLCSLHNVL